MTIRTCDVCKHMYLTETPLTEDEDGVLTCPYGHEVDEPADGFGSDPYWEPPTIPFHDHLNGSRHAGETCGTCET